MSGLLVPPPRLSAAVVLTRTSGEGLEVFVAERSEKLRFFGGYWAFPGGAVDDSDQPEAVRATALREIFEETGVWLGRTPLPDLEPRDHLRRTALAAEGTDETSPLEEFCHEAALALLECSSDEPGRGLEQVFEITTPPFAPRRFRTIFFSAALPEGEQPDVWPGELVRGHFVRPGEFLEEWERGEVLIAPPVILLLELLRDSESDGSGAAGFRRRARAWQEDLAEGRLHPVRFSPGIFVAPLKTRTKPPATTTNAFLVGGERMTIVDPSPTLESEQTRFFGEIDRRIEGGARVDRVLLTHHHPDHIGAVVETCRRYGVAVGGHAETIARLEEAVPVDVDSLFEVGDGERFDLGRAPDGSTNWSLEAIHTPGHAPGHLAFQESRYHAVIAGDLISAISTMVIDPPEGHMATYLESLEKLRDRRLGMVYPSHGPALHRGADAFTQLIAHRAWREERILAALARGERAFESLVAEVYDDVPEDRWPMAERSLRAGLIKLAEEGRVECHEPSSAAGGQSAEETWTAEETWIRVEGSESG